MSNPEVECWAKVAAKIGGRLELRHIFKGPRSKRRRFGLPSLTCSLEGVQVHGEVTGEGDPPATFVQLSAQVPGAVGLQLRVYRSFVFPQFGRVLGQDFVVGDPDFDRNFIVKSSDPHYAKLWLGPSTRNQMLLAPDYSFEIDAERVTANTHLADDAGQLEASMRAVARLAVQGTRIDNRVVRLAQGLSSEFTGSDEPWLRGELPSFEFISGGRSVTLKILHARIGRRSRRRLLSRLWCRRLTARSDRFVFYADYLGRKERPALAGKLARNDLGSLHPKGFIVHASNPARLEARITERWAKTLTRLAPLALTCSEAAVELTWPGAMLTEETLRDAASLCEYFAVESQSVVSAGPYR